MLDVFVFKPSSSSCSWELVPVSPESVRTQFPEVDSYHYSRQFCRISCISCRFFLYFPVNFFLSQDNSTPVCSYEMLKSKFPVLGLCLVWRKLYRVGFTYPRRREKCWGWRKIKFKVGKLWKQTCQKKTKLMYYVQQTGQDHVHWKRKVPGIKGALILCFWRRMK